MMLQNGFATHFETSLLISMRTVSLASLQSGRSVDADSWCKQALKKHVLLQTFWYANIFQYTRGVHKQDCLSFSKPLGIPDEHDLMLIKALLFQHQGGFMICPEITSSLDKPVRFGNYKKVRNNSVVLWTESLIEKIPKFWLNFTKILIDNH